jgi:hypothetical protein
MFIVIRNYNDNTGWHTEFLPVLVDGSLGNGSVNLDRAKRESEFNGSAKLVKMPQESSWEYTLMEVKKLPKFPG